MNDLVLLCLILFICVRVIGLAVSIDYFHDTKDNRFIYLMLGWTLWIIAALFPIFSNIFQNDMLLEFHLFLNALFGLIGGIFYTWGFYSYFVSIQFKKLVVLLIISILLPFSLYILINFRTAIQVSTVLLNILIFAAYIFPRLLIKDFKSYLGKSNIWYYITLLSLVLYIPISVMTSLLGHNYGLYETENSLIIMLYYAPTISSSILFIILLVHLEYTTSTRQKNDLKDKFSHNLGNIIQVINSASDLIDMSANLKEQEKKNLSLVQAKCKESAKLIKEIRDL